jgi:hypothetical protein
VKVFFSDGRQRFEKNGSSGKCGNWLKPATAVSEQSAGACQLERRAVSQVNNKFKKSS